MSDDLRKLCLLNGIYRHRRFLFPGEVKTCFCISIRNSSSKLEVSDGFFR